MTIIWADHKLSDAEISQLAEHQPAMQLTHPYRAAMVCVFWAAVLLAAWKWW